MKYRKALRKVGQEIYKGHDKIGTKTICSSHSRQLCSMLRVSVNNTHRELVHHLDKPYNGLGSWEDTRAQYSDWSQRTQPSEIPVHMFRFQEKNVRQIVINWDSLEYLTSQSLYRRCFGKNQHRLLNPQIILYE
jgi:hypothetical protein